ncbi:MAG: Gfo/Idh/MocA family oxidoreductase [Mycobacterium sp.]
MSDEIGIGVIGCGGFGLFALQQFAQVPGVRLAAMAGTAREASVAAAQRYGLDDVVDVDRLLDLPTVDLVYLATPPFLHYEQSKRALRAGKHVICEKPLALTVEQADELVELAREKDLLLVANLMQRYNPLYDAVGRIIEGQALGEFLHGYFENYASDENLPPQHWFWDADKSGGIFLEHGVHFFDMLSGWLGDGEVVAAQASSRSDGCEDQVQCTVRYPGGSLFNFYHGFHQPGRLDRQELRLVFERGDVLLQGWVPTSIRIHAVADEAQTRELNELLPGARIDVLTTCSPRDRAFYSHGRDHDAYQRFDLYWEDLEKMPLYCELLRRMMSDQVSWIRDRTHRRRVDERNARDSVAMACAADALAHLNR